ncbi:MAG: extracellular solute-binding protein [Pelagibacteraceae bacterium]
MLTIITTFSILVSNLLANEVNVFSSRHYDTDIQLYEKFTNQTGIKVNIISGEDAALQKRIIEEGKDSKADIYITSDAGRLGLFDAKGMFQNSMSPLIIDKVPKNYRSENWTGISKRARIIFYSKDRVKNNEIENLNYEDLSNIKWKNRIAIRQSNSIYNQSLVASLISNNGIEKTKKWTEGFVKNFSRTPKGNDRAQILAVASGEADIAIANTYYYALMLSGQKGKDQQDAARNVTPFYPNQGNRGTHMNISGAGILKNSKNKQNAIIFLEFLLSKESQDHIVKNTFEYPIIKDFDSYELITNMNLEISFKEDLLTPVSDFAKYQPEALRIMLQSGWK